MIAEQEARLIVQEARLIVQQVRPTMVVGSQVLLPAGSETNRAAGQSNLS